MTAKKCTKKRDAGAKLFIECRGFFAVLDAFTWSLLKALFTLYQLAFAQARKLFRIGFPFIHKIDDFGAVICDGAKLCRTNLEHCGASYVE